MEQENQETQELNSYLAIFFRENHSVPGPIQ